MSDSDDDDGCYFGTPLEELDADDVRKTKAPRIEDQIVCDKQGRRRFHGAFTGGFSAGYFNSVGTKEGWTPSTFVSSRGQRAESQQTAKPQDFMDDEDLAAHGISPQGIQATSNFDDSEQRKRKRVIDPGGPIPGTPVLEEILKPTKETMGMKLLRRLGWKPGQGIGPRVKLGQKRLAQKETHKIYGCKMPQDMGDESDEDADEENYDPDMTFAPDDIEALYVTTPKSDQFGLGYKPLDRTPVLGGHINLFDPSPLVMKEKKKKVLIKGQAFGVGAFEDEDEDIYAMEDMSCYDFGEEKSTVKNTPQAAKSHMDLMGLVEMIDGFSLSSKQQSDSKTYQYPKPTLPKDFFPQHKSRRRRFELKENEVKGLGRHDMSSEQRARIIAERPQTTVEVRSGVKGQAVKTPKKSTEKSNDTSDIDKIFEEFQNLEEKSRPDFKPFAKNEEKQRRYDLYLKMKDKGQKDRYYLAQPKTMTEWQKQREVQEFDRAAKLFRPLTSTMASRFVTAAMEDGGLKLKDGLNLEVPKAPERSSTSEVDALGHDVADDRTKAAKMNMFGKLTQTTIDWYPDRLLCRRFNIPSPFPESNFVGVRKTKRDKFSIFSILDAPTERGTRRRDDSPPRPSSSKEKEESQDEVIEEKPETYGLKVPVDGPPTMDLFKAIFQDSDSENEDDNDEAEESKKTDLDKEPGAIENSSLPTEATVCSVRESSESEKTDSQSEISIKNSVDSFLSKMRRGNENRRDSVEETVSKDSQQKIRVSRFAPTKDTATGEVENIPKPVFMPRKKPQAPSEAVPAKGIFANIDFDILNSYRTSGSNSKQNENEDECDESRDKVEEKDDNDHQKVNSDSSVDSEDEYGPPVPVHLKNRQQMIRSPPSSGIQRMGSIEPKSNQESLWVVKDDKRRSEKKHRHADKCKKKKEKKKKRHKERKHKKKSSKKSRRKSSSSSPSDSSGD